ncbi:MAG: hypothetical protein QOI93_4418 [Rhodospirillaceae bacterium]|jgi:hypothetical protein|nr:hypothetical protein [Rhodospirillaceae bacterium]
MTGAALTMHDEDHHHHVVGMGGVVHGRLEGEGEPVLPRVGQAASRMASGRMTITARSTGGSIAAIEVTDS